MLMFECHLFKFLLQESWHANGPGSYIEISGAAVSGREVRGLRKFCG